jgi:magnesium-transporting ATPase (P-type)
MDPERDYEAKWAEYQGVMHRGAWRIGWGFFAVTVGFLPLMWFFIWMVGAGNWEKTLFHAPLLMWVAVPLSLVVVVALILHLYRLNLDLDARKRAYLSELKALKARLPQAAPPPPPPGPATDPDSFRDDFQPHS